MLYSALRKASLVFGYAGILLLFLAPEMASATVWKLTTDGFPNSPATGTCIVNVSAGVLMLDSCVNTMDVTATDLHISATYKQPGQSKAIFSKNLNFDPIKVSPGGSFEPQAPGNTIFDRGDQLKAECDDLILNVSGFWTTKGGPRSRSASAISSTASASPDVSCSVPEPETAMLMVVGGAGLAFIRTRRRQGRGKADLNKMC